ncbi:unnamed protein product [Ectocarpus sp. 12 AP-2014]
MHGKPAIATKLPTSRPNCSIVHIIDIGCESSAVTHAVLNFALSWLPQSSHETECVASAVHCCITAGLVVEVLCIHSNSYRCVSEVAVRSVTTSGHQHFCSS